MDLVRQKICDVPLMLIMHQEYYITPKTVKQYVEAGFRYYYCPRCDSYPEIEQVKFLGKRIAHPVEMGHPW